MDDQIQRRVTEFVATLANSQQEKLAAAGTFVDIEELTAEIGDEVARQLANDELGHREVLYFSGQCCVLILGGLLGFEFCWGDVAQR